MEYEAWIGNMRTKLLHATYICYTDCVIDIVNVGVFGDFVIEYLSELEQVERY